MTFAIHVGPQPTLVQHSGKTPFSFSSDNCVTDVLTCICSPKAVNIQLLPGVTAAHPPAGNNSTAALVSAGKLKEG